ncbi:type IX secretion system protein PorQ [Paraflavitalea sp. CAU 1676]|uniref:type IX secretion system protein PorQ n=1 Tax=Paraflavitalea sp. CAU 1676 TaxID=3032598 RepID=UPI0023DABCF1|nr:type IX secretion system protein PorQ [Paraflavitalea sp. CAU 1676]MDF2189514.1 type IX secretion system protein PorQ [Paraflavitalea sp. CAU 1676]
MRKVLLIPVLMLITVYGFAQTLGGNTVYNFLRLSNTPQLTALGGINVSNQSPDIGLAWHNPSLLRASMHTQANFVFNAFYADIRNYHLFTGFRHEASKTNFAIGVNYFNYGTIPATDMAGNRFGDIRPADYVVQLSASRQYLERWHYGASLKFIYSNYGMYRSSGLAMDIGISYADTANLLQASLVIKNMGAQLKAYTGTATGDLPFDLQMGISKRLAKAPLQFSLTAHHLHQFDISYRDTAFNNENGFDQNMSDKKFTFDQLFRHIVLAMQVYITDKVEISAGYNHLRRRELNVGNTGNGINGFSLGVGALFRKLQIRYARSYYQNNTAYNQFGLSLTMKDYVRKGR